MVPLAEVSDKIVSPEQMWAVMGTFSVALGLYAIASWSLRCLILAVPISVAGFLFTLGLLDDPVFGDAVLRENGWLWFATNLSASLAPVATVVAMVIWRKSARRPAVGFPLDKS